MTTAMPRKAIDGGTTAEVASARGSSWLDWKRSCHRLLNARMREHVDIAGRSQYGSLHAVLSILIDHCSGQNQLPDGRLVCWPAIESGESGRGLTEWLGHSGRYLRDLIGTLATLGVIEIRYSPKSSASCTRHNGSLALKGVRRTLGLCNAYFIAVPYVAMAADDAPAVESASPAVVASAGPRPVPLRSRAQRTPPWYRVGNLPDLPKPLREEWNRTRGRENVLVYMAWLADTWGERRTDGEAFAFHKTEWATWKQQLGAAARGAAVQQRDAGTQQQLQERSAKRAAAHG